MGMKKQLADAISVYIWLGSKISKIDVIMQLGGAEIISPEECRLLLKDQVGMKKRHDALAKEISTLRSSYRNVLGARIDADSGERWVGSSDVNIPRDDY